MKILARSIPLISLTLLLPLQSSAWNQLGHMIVANIAYQNLTQSARDKVDHLVPYLHAEYPDMGTFPVIATWPDALRGQRIETYTHWHYIDNAISLDGSTLKNMVDTDNAVWALRNIEAVVKNAQSNPYEHVRFLSFMAHIVGDLHQPLHTVTNISRRNPDGDKGGNLTYVQYKGERVNLHKLWDEGLGMFEGEASAQRMEDLTRQITGDYPESSIVNKAADLNYDDWTREGMDNATGYVYNTPEDKAPSEEYFKNGRQIVEQQVALAGYRLAHLLNQKLG